jgi:hypothetical protein
MNPDPCRVRAAVGILDADSHEGAPIGDTTADVFAGVPVIGYDNKRGKARALPRRRPGRPAQPRSWRVT